MDSSPGFTESFKCTAWEFVCRYRKSFVRRSCVSTKCCASQQNSPRNMPYRRLNRQRFIFQAISVVFEVREPRSLGFRDVGGEIIAGSGTLCAVSKWICINLGGGTCLSKIIIRHRMWNGFQGPNIPVSFLLSLRRLGAESTL